MGITQYNLADLPFKNIKVGDISGTDCLYLLVEVEKAEKRSLKDKSRKVASGIPFILAVL